MFEKHNALLKLPKYRAFDAFLFQSGLGSNDVLRLKYSVIQSDFEDGIIPICFRVVRGMSGRVHHTCIGPETIQLLKVHFDKNGIPKSEQPIFNMSRCSIDAIYADRAKKLSISLDFGNAMSPHSLRKFFRKRIIQSHCPSPYVEHFMGHDLDSLQMVDASIKVDDCREVYTKYMSALSFQIL